MEHPEQHETPPFVPVIPRLDRLDRLILEEKHSCSFSRSRDNDDVNVNNLESCTSLSSALEEVQRKGTLVERLTCLENRVLQLSQRMEMDEGNTSKSSSSTTTAKESECRTMAVTAREMRHSSTGRPHGEGIVRETISQQKRKNPYKWLGLFKFRC